MTDRLPEENDRQYLGYSTYRDQGPVRTLIASYIEYWTKTHSGAGKRGECPRKPPANFTQWRSKFHWDDRVRAWDFEQETRERDLQIQADSEKYLSELKQFRDCQLRLGKAGVLAAIKIKQQLISFIENFGEIETLDDAVEFAKICKLLEGGSEAWAKALCVDQLLENLK